MNPKTDRMVYLKDRAIPEKTIELWLSWLLYVAVFIAGAAFSQFTRNIELTEAVGLAVRIACELAGAFLGLGLIAVGVWTVIQRLKEEL